MKKQKNKGMVEIPQITLNALKNLLFNDEGMNIFPIIEDLSTGWAEDHKDLLAIHVALVMKGIKPDIDIPQVQFWNGWRNVKVYIYKGYSLIRGVAKFKVYTINWEDNEWHLKEDFHTEVFDLDHSSDMKSSYTDLEMTGLNDGETPHYDKLDYPIKEIFRKEGFYEQA